MNRFRTFLLLALTISCPACSQDAAGPVAIQQGGDAAGPVAIQQDGDQSQAPLEIRFKEACGLPEGREHIYDPKTGIFHVHFKPRDYGHTTSLDPSAFEVTKVGGRFAKPVVFRFTGVPEGYGCVGYPLGLYTRPAFSWSDARYVFDECDLSILAGERCDKTLFRVERKEDVVTVEFTEKGQALLKPGVDIGFAVDTGW